MKLVHSNSDANETLQLIERVRLDHEYEAIGCFLVKDWLGINFSKNLKKQIRNAPEPFENVLVCISIGEEHDVEHFGLYSLNEDDIIFPLIYKNTTNSQIVISLQFARILGRE